jgi:mono/diheme cytochrome c family protein
MGRPGGRGASGRRASVSIALALLAITQLFCTAAPGFAAEGFGLGRTPTPDEINALDIDIMPDGRGLPSGQGTAKQGQAVYDAACSQCHGEDGRGGIGGALAGAAPHDPSEFAADKALQRTVGNYWPYATTLFDYIRRAMPYDRPGSLSSEELYALTAYILHLNGLIEAGAVMNSDTLPAVSMPARQFFKAAGRRGDAP